MTLRLLIVLMLLIVLSSNFVLSGGLARNTFISVLRLVPRGPPQRFRMRNKPRDWAKSQRKIQIKMIPRGWCILSMTSCFITFWPPCVVRTARRAWRQQELSSSILWLDGESTGDGILLFHPDDVASDVLLQVCFASIDACLRMVVLFHDIPCRGKSTWTSDSKVSPNFRRWCRLHPGFESSRVST